MFTFSLNTVLRCPDQNPDYTATCHSHVVLQYGLDVKSRQVQFFCFATAMYRTTTRESSCSIIHPTMLAAPPPSSSRTLAQVTAKVYHAKFGSGDDWQYFNQRGTVIFGQDQNQNRNEEQGTTITNTPIEDVGLDLKPAGVHYWFRLRDESNGRIVWMFQVPEECIYRVDKPFFHVFNGKVSPFRPFRSSCLCLSTSY